MPSPARHRPEVFPRRLRPASTGCRRARWRTAGLLTVGLLVTVLAGPAGAQPVSRLTGTVRDAVTGESLPFCNIRVLESQLGTITNSEGAYLLNLVSGVRRLVFSHLGYHSDTLRVALGSAPQVLDVALEPSIIELPPLVIRADVGDLAEFIIAQAIARKHETLDRLHSLSYDAWTRTILRVRMRQEGVWKEEIAGITETLTRGWWRAPGDFSETILARRQTANFTPATNVFTAGPLPDFNRDVVSVDRYEVLGPTAPAALDRYHYTILDTLALDGARVFRLRVEPRTQILPLFDGEIAIAEGSWLVMDVDLRGNEAMENRPIVGWRFRQRFARYQEDLWLPIEARTDLTVDMGMGFPVTIEQQAVLYDYRIDPELPPGLFGRELVGVAPDADLPDPGRWEQAQVVPLTEAERAAWDEIEQAMREAGPLVRTLLRLTQPHEEGVLSFSSFPDFARFNRVEGLRLGVGVRLREPWPGADLHLHAGHGFADERWKYDLTAEQVLATRPRLVAGAALSDAPAWREGTATWTPGRITWLTLLDHVDPVDYYHRRGGSLWLRWEASDFVRLGLTLRQEQHTSLVERSEYSLLERDRHYRPNAGIDDGRLNSAALRLTWDNRRFLSMGVLEIADESRDSWRMELEGEMSRGPYWGPDWESDFIFTRWLLRAVRHQRTFGAGFIDLIVTAGTATGDLPLQRMFDLDSGLKLFHRPGAFVTAGEKEFAGDRILSLWAEHNFGSLPLQLVGIRPRGLLDLDFLGHLAGGWTGLRTRPGPLPDGTRTTGPPVWEVGVGLGRVMGMFHVEFTKRVTTTEGRSWVFSMTGEF